MKKAILLFVMISVFLSLSSCDKLALPAPAVTSTPSVTPTPDLCSTTNLPDAVKAVNNLTRQFDDYASLASHSPKSQMVQVIPPLQAIRRAAQDQGAPACLKQLKIYQISYMDTMIQTLLVFESSPDVSGSDANVLKSGVAQAQQYHNLYVIELAHLLGMTVVVPPTNAPGTSAPSKTGTPAPTPVTVTITNPGSNPINLHSSASLTSSTIGAMNAGASASAVGKTAAGDWILIQVNGRSAWIYASLVKFSSGSIASLPVVTPNP